MIIGKQAFLEQQFDRVEGGWTAYKVFAAIHTPRPEWKIEADSWIVDPNLNTDPENDCAAGVNVASSVSWIEDLLSDTPGEWEAWEVFIPDDSIIVVPLTSDGKIRTNRLQLIEVFDTICIEEEWFDEDDDEDDDWDDDDDDDEDIWDDFDDDEEEEAEDDDPAQP